MNDGLDCLGAEVVPTKQVMSWTRGAIAIGAGFLGMFLVPKHPVLAFLNSAALASNAHALAKKDRTFKDAFRRMGRHVVATAGSLAMPRHAAIGYVAGAVAADLLIDGEGGGIIEEWADYEGIKNATKKIEEPVFDAEFVESEPSALVKT